MKYIKSLLMLAAITVASMTFVSCDDDPWYDPYGWSNNYGDWNWNNDYWNQGGNGNNRTYGDGPDSLWRMGR